MAPRSNATTRAAGAHQTPHACVNDYVRADDVARAVATSPDALRVPKARERLLRALRLGPRCPSSAVVDSTAALATLFRVDAIVGSRELLPVLVDVLHAVLRDVPTSSLSEDLLARFLALVYAACGYLYKLAYANNNNNNNNNSNNDNDTSENTLGSNTCHNPSFWVTVYAVFCGLELPTDTLPTPPPTALVTRTCWTRPAIFMQARKMGDMVVGLAERSARHASSSENKANAYAKLVDAYMFIVRFTILRWTIMNCTEEQNVMQEQDEFSSVLQKLCKAAAKALEYGETELIDTNPLNANFIPMLVNSFPNLQSSTIHLLQRLHVTALENCLESRPSGSNAVCNILTTLSVIYKGEIKLSSDQISDWPSVVKYIHYASKLPSCDATYWRTLVWDNVTNSNLSIGTIPYAVTILCTLSYDESSDAKSVCSRICDLWTTFCKSDATLDSSNYNVVLNSIITYMDYCLANATPYAALSLALSTKSLLSRMSEQIFVKLSLSLNLYISNICEASGFTGIAGKYLEKSRAELSHIPAGDRRFYAEACAFQYATHLCRIGDFKKACSIENEIRQRLDRDEDTKSWDRAKLATLKSVISYGDADINGSIATAESAFTIYCSLLKRATTSGTLIDGIYCWRLSPSTRKYALIYEFTELCLWIGTIYEISGKPWKVRNYLTASIGILSGSKIANGKMYVDKLLRQLDARNGVQPEQYVKPSDNESAVDITYCGLVLNGILTAAESDVGDCEKVLETITGFVKSPCNILNQLGLLVNSNEEGSAVCNMVTLNNVQKLLSTKIATDLLWQNRNETRAKTLIDATKLILPRCLVDPTRDVMPLRLFGEAAFSFTLITYEVVLESVKSRISIDGTEFLEGAWDNATIPVYDNLKQPLKRMWDTVPKLLLSVLKTQHHFLVSSWINFFLDLCFVSQHIVPCGAISKALALISSELYDVSLELAKDISPSMLLIDLLDYRFIVAHEDVPRQPRNVLRLFNRLPPDRFLAVIGFDSRRNIMYVGRVCNRIQLDADGILRNDLIAVFGRCNSLASDSRPIHTELEVFETLVRNSVDSTPFEPFKTAAVVDYEHEHGAIPDLPIEKHPDVYHFIERTARKNWWAAKRSLDSKMEAQLESIQSICLSICRELLRPISVPRLPKDVELSYREGRGDIAVKALEKKTFPETFMFYAAAEDALEYFFERITEIIQDIVEQHCRLHSVPVPTLESGYISSKLSYLIDLIPQSALCVEEILDELNCILLRFAERELMRIGLAPKANVDCDLKALKCALDVFVTRINEAKDAAFKPIKLDTANNVFLERDFYAGRDGEVGFVQQAGILVVDKFVSKIPWESLPFLIGVDATLDRCPSFKYLRVSPHEVSRTRLSEHVFFLLNPGGDLLKTQALFESRFRTLCCPSEVNVTEGTRSIKGFISKEPLNVQEPVTFSDPILRTCIRKSGIFLYFGHGGGDQYINGKLLKRPTCDDTAHDLPIAMLFGCSSGKLAQNGNYDPTGTPLHYLQGGSEFVVSCLWDVTDGDLDRLSTRFLENCGIIPKETPNDSTSTQERELLADLLAQPLKFQKSNHKPASIPSKGAVGSDSSPCLDSSFDEIADDPRMLSLCLSSAKEQCKLRTITGAAVVIYRGIV